MSVYKNEKRGTWYATFRYTDLDGKRRQKKKEGFRTKREAQEYEREFLLKKSGTTDMTFKALTELYMEDCASRLRTTTLHSRKSVIESRILPYFAALSVRDITPTIIRKWQNDLLNSSEDYTDGYIKLVNGILSSILNFAVKYYGLPQNPSTICGIPKKHTKHEMNFWTRDEFKQFIKYEKNPTARLAFEILFWTGMRHGELLALTLNDVDFERAAISITKSAAFIGGEKIINPPKTKKSQRDIFVPNFLLAMIKDYSNHLIDYEPQEQLFTFSRDFLAYHMQIVCEASGVKKIRIHDLRHSHASMLIEMGCDPLLVAERLGHESVQTTLQIYSHLYPNKQKEIASKLEISENENYSDIISNFERDFEDLQ